MTEKRPDVDERCFDLAVHFLNDIAGVTEDDFWVLAALLQTACEDVCRDVESRHADRRETDPAPD